MEDDAQSNIDSQSYGEHCITNDSEKIQQERYNEIEKAQTILKQTDEFIHHNNTEAIQYENTSMHHDTSTGNMSTDLTGTEHDNYNKKPVTYFLPFKPIS